METTNVNIHQNTADRTLDSFDILGGKSKRL
jgi:hypothetical protein